MHGHHDLLHRSSRIRITVLVYDKSHRTSIFIFRFGALLKVKVVDCLGSVPARTNTDLEPAIYRWELHSREE